MRLLMFFFVWWCCYFSQLSDQRCLNVSTVHLQTSSRCFCFKDWWLDMTRVTRYDQRPSTSWRWHHWHYLWHAYCIYQSNIYKTLIFTMQCSTLRGHPNTYLGDSWWSILWHHMASLTCWSFSTYVQSSPTMTYHFNPFHWRLMLMYISPKISEPQSINE